MTGGSFLHIPLVVLLTLIVGGSGPIVFAAMPRTFNANAEEETRTVDVTVGGGVSAGVRISRGREGRPARQRPCLSRNRPASRAASIDLAGAMPSLHALSMRIQV